MSAREKAIRALEDKWEQWNCELGRGDATMSVSAIESAGLVIIDKEDLKKLEDAYAFEQMRQGNSTLACKQCGAMKLCGLGCERCDR